MQVNSCCCFTLKTGGLFLGYIGLLVSIGSIVVSLINGEAKLLVSALFVVVLASFYLYGICNKKPKLVLPYLVVLWVHFVCLILLLIFIPIGALLGAHQQLFEDDVNGTVIAGVWFLIVIYAAIVFYLNLVTQTLYISIRHENSLLPKNRGWSADFTSQTINPFIDD